MLAAWNAASALGALVHSGTPADVPPSFDCAIRSAAWQYGKKLLPERGQFSTLFDALQLGACPGLSRPAERDTWSQRDDPLPTDQPVLFVSTATATGTVAESQQHTYKTVHEAVEASRRLRARGAPATIALRQGVHYVGETLQLGEADSGLTLRSYPGEAAGLSAGVPLSTEWRKSSACRGSAPCYEADLSAQRVGAFSGLRLHGKRQIRARFPNFDPELDSVIDGQHLVHDGKMGWIGDQTEWVESGANGMNGIHGEWPPTATATTYVIDDDDWPSVDWPMHIMSNGTVDPSDWTGEGSWGQYWIGVGGTCVDRQPAAGYWCAPDAPRAISSPNHPVGIRPTAAQLPHLPYANATGAVVHAWRPGHWCMRLLIERRS
jgi:hypothetical protein